MEEFGFVAWKALSGNWYVDVATRINGVVTVHDVSGFPCGSWNVKNDHMFFPRVSDSVFCFIASKQATDYCIYREQP